MKEKTKQKEFDKILSRLQKMQRECFKKGSVTALEVKPRYENDDTKFVIYVTAYNLNVVKTTSDGDEFHFESFYFYSFYGYEENEKELQRIVDFLSIA